MSSFKPQTVLEGSQRHVHKFKTCTSCGESKPPEGGIELSPTKWQCCHCWTRKASAPKKRS